jgi:hypothetical protein
LASFPFIPDLETTTSILQFFCVVLIWLITEGVLKSASTFSIASKKIDDIENRLSLILEGETIEQDLLFVLGDYNSVTQSVQTISSSIYRKNKEKLNKLWFERISSKLD